MGDPTTEQLHRNAASLSLRVVLANMVEIRAALLKEMPGKMDAFADRIDDWCRGIAPAIRELERGAYSAPTNSTEDSE